VPDRAAMLPPPIHPFPARMAPEIAIEFCQNLRRGATVLDPMVGSGTTIRAAIDSGHHAIGIDMDPLAVMLARAWTTPVNLEPFIARARQVMAQASELSSSSLRLPWIDDDAETSAFVDRWFGEKQRPMLRSLAHVLYGRHGATWNLCRVALSRIIITKDRGASLGRDVSHSRPHITYKSSDYDVLLGFRRACDVIARRLVDDPPRRRAIVRRGDARTPDIRPRSVDAVITSPPYLNAIDYLRGHRMSLVWMGYSVRELREIRAAEVGAERALLSDDSYVSATISQMGDVGSLPNRLRGMIRRYAQDTRMVVSAAAATLKPGGSALFVVGNSSLKGVFLRNDRAIELAAKEAGLELVGRAERDLPPNRRYLPPPMSREGDLNQRMRREVVLTFRALA
jgi:DNA modification methylase